MTESATARAMSNRPPPSEVISGDGAPSGSSQWTWTSSDCMLAGIDLVDHIDRIGADHAAANVRHAALCPSQIGEL